jgi:CheY-like chemotaxis protein
MPLMNGLEETRILKKLMPAVPVIIFTSHSDPLVEKEAAAAGACSVQVSGCYRSNRHGAKLAQPEGSLIYSVFHVR